MKHSFRIMIGMLLFAVPLCLNAQIKPTKPNNNDGDKPKAEIKIEKTTSPEVKPEAPAKPDKPAPKGGFEMPKISGFVQTFYTANMDDDGALQDNEFKIRRARLSVDGKFGEKFSYKLQGDFTGTPALVDAYLKYKFCDAFALQAGQFKTPFTLESPINPVNLEIYDYGESISKLVGYKDVCGVGKLGRDLGIMATGDLIPLKDKGFSVINYAIGVFNGNGANALDNNNRKDIVGRLNVHPGLKDLTLSGSYYYGKYSTDVVDRGSRNRWTAGAQYNDGNLIVRAEYLSGSTGRNTVVDSTNVIISEDLFNSNGYYAVAGYNFKLGKNKSQQLMPVFRYEHFTKDVSIEKSGTTFYTVGLSYWPIKYVNLKVNYQLIENYQKTTDDTYDKVFANRVVAAVNFKF